MKIAVLSGKGGTGKTFVSVNLAYVAENSIYCDCDVEEPNGGLFFKPECEEKSDVFVSVPEINFLKCVGCRKCVDFCRFNALVFIREKPMLFNEICHFCGGCKKICDYGAIGEKNKQVGIIKKGRSGAISVLSGILNIGEPSAVPVIKAELNMVDNELFRTEEDIKVKDDELFKTDCNINNSIKNDIKNIDIKKVENSGESDFICNSKEETCKSGRTVVIDCPPGSSCAVSESISGVDYCLIVTEPTSFAFSNFKMVYELATLYGKPCGVVVNKCESDYKPLEDFCNYHNLTVLSKIPFDKGLASYLSDGEIAAKADLKYHKIFEELYNKIIAENGDNRPIEGLIDKNMAFCGENKEGKQ